MFGAILASMLENVKFHKYDSLDQLIKIRRLSDECTAAFIQLSFQMSRTAALVRSHMNGWLPFESTIEQTTEAMPLSLKQLNSCCNDETIAAFDNCLRHLCEMKVCGLVTRS